MKQDKIYIILSVIFSVLIVLGNLIYQKFVHLDLFGLIKFELSVGAILYPLTFLITDLIAEFYGKDNANFCVKLGIAANIMVALIIGLMDILPATGWSKITNQEFHKIFGFYNIAFLGSILACFISQSLDIKIYLFIKKLTRDRFLWLRNFVSTSISLMIDTAIVIIFMSIFGIFPKEQIFPLITNSYSFKLLFTALNIPIFYFAVFYIKRKSHSEAFS